MVISNLVSITLKDRLIFYIYINTFSGFLQLVYNKALLLS